MKVAAFEIGGQGGRRSEEPLDPVMVKGSVLKVPAVTPIGRYSELLNYVCDNTHEDADAVSVSIAGKNLGNRIMVFSPNMKFLNGKDIAGDVTRRTGKPCTIHNDMSTVAWALMPFFNGKHKAWAVFTWSTGINGRIVINGVIINDDGEMGHRILIPEIFGVMCSCNHPNHLEGLLAGKKIAAMVLEARKIHKFCIPKGMDPNVYLDIAYNKGDDWAVKIYDYLARMMAAYLASFKADFPSVSMVVFKGGVAYGKLLKIEPSMRRYMGIFSMDAIDVSPAGLGIELSPLVKDTDALIGSVLAHQAVTSRAE